MCDPVSAALAGSAMLTAYGGKRSADSAQNAQFTKMSNDSNRQNLEFLSGINQKRDVFSADQVRAQEIQGIQNQERIQQAALGEQQKEIAGKRLGVTFDQIQAQEAEFQAQQAAQALAVAPTEEIADDLNTQWTIEDAQTELGSAIDDSAVAGGQDIGASEGFGKVSSSYSEGADSAKESNISKAKTRARRLGTSVGIGNLQQQNSQSIADSGFSANLGRSDAARKLRMSNQISAQRLGNLSAQEGTLSRQEQLNQLISGIERTGIDNRFGLAQGEAALNNALAPEDYQYIDPTNRSAQLYSLIGNLGTAAASGAFGSFGGSGNPAGNAAVNVTPQRQAMFAGLA